MLIKIPRLDPTCDLNRRLAAGGFVRFGHVDQRQLGIARICSGAGPVQLQAPRAFESVRKSLAVCQRWDEKCAGCFEVRKRVSLVVVSGD